MSRLQEVARPLEYQLYRYLIDKDKEAGPKALDARLEWMGTLTLEAVLGMKTCELFPKIM